MTGSQLTTARLTLSPVALSDFEALVALWRDEGFYRHITGRPLSEEEVWFRLLRDIGHWSALGHGNWAIRLTETGDYVGSVGVLDFHREITPRLDAPELGWGVGGAFQGQGLAGEALAAALDWADRKMKAPRTVCMIAPANHPSLRLAERSGYRPYAEGVYHDEAAILLQRPNPTLAGH